MKRIGRIKISTQNCIFAAAKEKNRTTEKKKMVHSESNYTGVEVTQKTGASSSACGNTAEESASLKNSL